MNYTNNDHKIHNTSTKKQQWTFQNTEIGDKKHRNSNQESINAGNLTQYIVQCANCHEASGSGCDVPPAVCKSSRKIEEESCWVVLRSALPQAARCLEPPARISRTLYTQRIPVADIVNILPFRSAAWPSSQIQTQGRDLLRVCLCFLSTSVSGCMNGTKFCSPFFFFREDLQP
jgi:hypothetical protein